MLQDTLISLGYEVTGCWSSTEALSIFGRMPDSFDLLITDQTMPKMTGTALAGEIQKIRPGFPVILCSGFSEPLERETLRKSGIVDCVMKPVLRKDIAKAVRMAMKQEES
jgi:CheY-like chemotaxis protein